MKITNRHNSFQDTEPHMVLLKDISEQVGEVSGHAFMRGDESAYAQLYERYFPDLYNYGVKLCGEPDYAKDCIHDLFIDLWKRRKKLQNVSSVKPYLFKALRNIILKAQTRQPFFQSVDVAYHFEIQPSSETALINQQMDQAQQQQLYAALNTLTQRQREVVFLKFYSQLTYDEVASVLGISTKATYKLMARAIDILRQKIVPLVWWASLISSISRF